MTDSVEDADALILMANYLLKLIDQSKSPYEKVSFLKRVFDPMFPPDREYAKLLVQEIPPGQRLDVSIQVFRDRGTGAVNSIPLFIAALIDLLTEPEVEQFCSVVSDELKTVEDDQDIRTAIQVTPSSLWCRYSELARRRIEYRLIQAIKDGRYNRTSNKFVSGSLGSWAIELIPFFTLRNELAEAITEKVTSSDNMAQAYGLQFFFEFLPKLQSKPSIALRNTVSHALQSQNLMFYESLWWLQEEQTPEAWRDAFLMAYRAVITDDDVPF
jgi:hypothetical protein